MKAIYKSIFFCLTLMLGFTACDNHDEIPPTGGLDNAEKLVAGTYVGEWSRVNVATEAVESGVGSITFSVDQELGNNVSVMTLESALDLGVNADTSVCNITRLSSGDFTYWNYSGTNPFGMTFYGKVSPEGVATMTYNKIVRSGRKEVEFQYSFSGTKQ